MPEGSNTLAGNSLPRLFELANPGDDGWGLDRNERL